jgi:NodT family efflux transporter outer membrane factor (OMF) lipoprotein
MTARLSAIAAAALLAGCAAFPSSKTALPRVDDVKVASKFDAPAAGWPADAWWTAYGDRQLDALIADALAGTPTLAVAKARLDRARANARVANSTDAPQLSANTSPTLQKQSSNYLSPSAATPHGWNDYGRATLDLQWNLDLWGGNRAALAAATSEAVAAEADVAQARLVLTTSLAAAYVEFARQFAALDTARSTLRIREETERSMRLRADAGVEVRASLRQAQARLALAHVDAMQAAEQIELQRNRIAALVGQGPEKGRALARPSLDLSRAFGLPAEVAAQLVGRRPDVAASRLRAEAAGQRIGQARAAFYPNVNLLAFAGFQSLGLNMLTKGGSAIGSIGPAVSLPIFDGGRLRGQLRGAEADYAASVASYEGALVQAVQEVADVAGSEKFIGGERANARMAVAAATEAWQLQDRRYRGGLATYLDVLAAEDTLVSSQRVLTDLDSRALALDVALVKALGGGWQSGQPTAH